MFERIRLLQRRRRRKVFLAHADCSSRCVGSMRLLQYAWVIVVEDALLLQLRRWSVDRKSAT